MLIVSRWPAFEIVGTPFLAAGPAHVNGSAITAADVEHLGESILGLTDFAVGRGG